MTKNPKKRTQSITELIGTPFLKANVGTQTSIFEDLSSKLPWSTLPKCIALEKQSVGGKEVIKVCTIKLPRPMFAKEMGNPTEIQKEMSKSPEMMTQQQGEAVKEIGEFLMRYLDGETFSKQIESIDVIENKTMERSMTLSTLPGLSKVSKLSPQIPHWTSADAVYQPGKLHINGDTPNIDEWISARTRVFNSWMEITKRSPKTKEVGEMFPGVNMIPVVRGSNPEFAMQNAATGFPNIAFIDSGFYGKGIYFTTSMEYASIYSSTVLFVGFLATGSVFPVVEDFGTNPSHSLMGAAQVNGYDTHVVLVHQLGMSQNWVPWCPIDEEEEKLVPPLSPGTKEYVELVTFNSSSVFPCFILHCK